MTLQAQGICVSSCRVFTVWPSLPPFLDAMSSDGEVDERTVAASKLREFMDKLEVPIVGYLRDTQYYLHMAAHGLSLFDLTPSKVQKDLQQWQVICEWLES